ncbi:MAG: elongation factor EF-2 [Candidatus Nitrosocaldus sp.]|nr:elongation factor EF-2 [Candidatus Nitrosocaldus sp.]MDW8275020.1 elongation factor EF-2 [Candidatus Nitrosocaldus sp.]
MAHVDHGKTTMSDSLLAATGMISPSVAGEALALDYWDLEQQRQMTIKAANVTLYYEHENKPYVINMIDTPGHIDFTGRVTRSLRAIDGVCVVCDSVEGIMTQTETVTRQALEERVRPVLYINKIDRLVKELRLTPDKMQEWLARIIADFNRLIDIYAEPEFRDKWKVSIQSDSVAFGSAKDRWGITASIAAKKGFKFKDVYDAYTTPDGGKGLAERVPLHEAILGMVVKHHPPPHVAQKYRIPKIWKGDLESDVGRALLECDENGPAVMMVTNVVVDPQAGPVAVGRLYSGTIHDGDHVYLVGSKRMERVQSVTMFMGPYREIVGSLTAGNIPALLGLEHARAGETIASIKDIVPFESIRYVSEPVVTVAIEPKHPKDLPKLVEALRRISIEDPNLVVKINEETGEMLMAGMGVLHLEIATTLLQQQGLEIVTSKPLINYRESIRSKAGPVMAKSPNRHNKVYVRIEPLSADVVDMLVTGRINENMDRKQVAALLREKGWDADEAKGIVAIEGSNVFVDATKGVQYLQESMDSLRSGFTDVMLAGPLVQEQCRGIKVVLHHFVPHEDPAHRTLAQLLPASRRAIMGAMLSADPVILEPILGIEIRCPAEMIGTVAGVLSGKRGKLLNIDQKGVIAIVQGEIPAAETSDLSEVMRGATAGKAMWNTHFKMWQAVPASLTQQLIADIRKRKGLSPEPPRADEFIDKE